MNRFYKGRGAVSNRTGRFENQSYHDFDDGWGGLEQVDGGPPKTTTIEDHSKSIIVKNNSPDIPFEQSINPYRGCEHGCIYCYARPSHTYLGFSAGRDFETQIVIKPGAAQLLKTTLERTSYRCKVITLGANTDAYQPLERRLEITRAILQVAADFRQPIVIITKSALVLRDLDILTQMASRRLVRVLVSLTTLCPRLAGAMEPRAASPPRRLETIHQLSQAGIPVTVMTAPMIPGLNDHELETLLSKGCQAGADRAGYVLLRLPHELKALFAEWLEHHYPLKAKKVFKLLEQMRGGRRNQAHFGTRMRGTGPLADLLATRFKNACKRLDLNKGSFKLRTDLFQRPPRAGDQLELFSESYR